MNYDDLKVKFDFEPEDLNPDVCKETEKTENKDSTSNETVLGIQKRKKSVTFNLPEDETEDSVNEEIKVCILCTVLKFAFLVAGINIL